MHTVTENGHMENSIRRKFKATWHNPQVPLKYFFFGDFCIYCIVYIDDNSMKHSIWC